MHRRPLLDLLDRYEPTADDPPGIAERIRSLVENHADCFERTCRPGHITGSAWVLSADRRRCLLLHHRKLGRWLQPGGHADGDPDVLAVALREAVEESGIPSLKSVTDDAGAIAPFDLDVHLIPARQGVDRSLIEDAHEHHDFRFLLQATEEADPVVSDESNDVRWFTPAEIRAATDEESVLRLLRKSETYLECDPSR